MKSEQAVLNILYKYFNVGDITALLDGSIYLKKRPVNSDLKDLVINNLPIQEGDTQSVTVFLNAYALNYAKNGLPQIVYLDKIANALITRIESYVKTTGVFLSMEIIDQGVLNDTERKNTSYSSIRLLCNIEE